MPDQYMAGLVMFIERFDRAGFSQNEVRGILGGNFLRIFRHNRLEDSPVCWGQR